MQIEVTQRRVNCKQQPPRPARTRQTVIDGAPSLPGRCLAWLRHSPGGHGIPWGASWGWEASSHSQITGDHTSGGALQPLADLTSPSTVLSPPTGQPPAGASVDRISPEDKWRRLMRCGLQSLSPGIMEQRSSVAFLVFSFLAMLVFTLCLIHLFL